MALLTRWSLVAYGRWPMPGDLWLTAGADHRRRPVGRLAWELPTMPVSGGSWPGSE
jgi:hypothetical protein